MNSIEDYKLDLQTFNEVMNISSLYRPRKSSLEEKIFNYFNFRNALFILRKIKFSEKHNTFKVANDKYDCIEVTLLDTEKEFFGLKNYKKVFLICNSRVKGKPSYIELGK